MRDISWRGQSLRTLASASGYDVMITKIPGLDRASRKYESYAIPGRNGNIIIPQDAWDNITVSYEIIIGDGDTDHAPAAARLLAEWLSGGEQNELTLTNLNYLCINGYDRLSDSYDDGYERRACLIDGYTIESKLTKYAYATISFNCRPERYMTQGFTLRTSASVTNPFDFQAKPLIKVTRTGSNTSGVVTLSGTFAGTITVSNLSDSVPTIYVDSENMECYTPSLASWNSNVTLSNDFPILTKGSESITVSNVTFQIAPRFWCL